MLIYFGFSVRHAVCSAVVILVSDVFFFISRQDLTYFNLNIWIESFALCHGFSVLHYFEHFVVKYVVLMYFGFKTLSSTDFSLNFFDVMLLYGHLFLSRKEHICYKVIVCISWHQSFICQCSTI